MALRRSGRSVRPPELPYEEAASRLAFPKKKYRRDEEPAEQMDTRALPHRKIHPERDRPYLDWLRFQLCVIFGKVDAETGQTHICWSPDMVGPRQYASDPMHTGKAYSGRVKRSDKGAIPGCRHAHRQQEDNMDRFDRRFGIDRHALAEEYYARFTDEMHTKGLR